MTEHPLILVSAAFTKFLQICLQHSHTIKKSLTDERRLKRQHKMSIHCRNAYQQGVSAVNERKRPIFDSGVKNHTQYLPQTFVADS